LLAGIVTTVTGEYVDAGGIAACQEAGIRVVMITGDHAATAQAIGRDLGIAGDDTTVLTGAHLAELNEHKLRQQARSTAIYARVAPEQKLRVVRALQDEGEVMALTVWWRWPTDSVAYRAADRSLSSRRINSHRSWNSTGISLSG
jgi:Ca2+-transporting ATPase